MKLMIAMRQGQLAKLCALHQVILILASTSSTRFKSPIVIEVSSVFSALVSEVFSLFVYLMAIFK
jgi:hypothetical protein